MASTHTHWLVAVPNEHGSVDRCLDNMAAATVLRSKGSAEISYFKIPLTLKIGTLDSLMLLGDDLGRADATVESTVKKIERQVLEAATAVAEFDRAHQRAGAPGSGAGAGATAAGMVKSQAPRLLVNGMDPQTYIRTFAWDKERFDSSASLVDLTKQLTSLADKADADLRAYVAAYTEKKQQLAAVSRAQSGSLSTISLDDVLTQEVLDEAGVEFMNTEYLSTQVLVMQLSQEELFLQTYDTLDGESVPLGPEGDRESVRGSPVVPGSARRVKEDDGYVLYTVVILSKFVDSFRAAARAARLLPRPFEFDPERAGKGLQRLGALEAEVMDSLSHLKEQSTRKFADVFAVWMHLKAVRVFVESVLRFGLPVNFVCALIKPSQGYETKLHDSLKAKYAHLGDSDLLGADDDFGGGLGSGGMSAAAMGMSTESMYPYVFVPFSYQ